MQHQTISLDLLDGSKRNYRSHPPEQITKLKASLARFQQVRSIVVAPESTGRYTILAGHGVVEAARESGITEINCDVCPDDWDATTRDAYLVADNLHAQDAVDDSELLAQLLTEQQNAGYDLATMGSDDETLRQMLESLGDAYLSGDKEKDKEEKSGTLLALLDVTIADPRHAVSSGDIWKMGRHTLIIAHVFKDWPVWIPYLKDDTCLFLPFPGPMMALSEKAEEYTLVLVQPDTYVAGHILDRYTDIHGEKSVRKIEHVHVSLIEENEVERENVDG